MKLSTLAIAIVLAGVVGVASAAGPANTKSPAAVAVSACTPPNDTTGHACDDFNRMIRANFSPREIGMLFGYSSNYATHLTGGPTQLQRRYQALMQDYIAAHDAATSADVAAR